MNPNLKSRLVLTALLLFTASLFLIVFGVVANAQDFTQTQLPSVQGQGSGSPGLSDRIINLAAEYPWIASFLIMLGTLRLCIKPIMTLARYIVNSTERGSDNVALDKVEHSLLYTSFLFCLDWLTSIKLKAKSADEPLNKALRMLIFTLLPSSFILLTSGCAGRTTAQVVRALSKDPASLHVRITSIYGTIEVARTAPNTNSPAHTIGTDGSITVK